MAAPRSTRLPAVDPEVLVVSIGAMAGTSTTVAEKLAAEGRSWVLG